MTCSGRRQQQQQLFVVAGVLTLAVASATAFAHVWGPSPTFHKYGMSGGASKISIQVPPPSRRNPDKCELYETLDYMEAGCKQHCSVNGYFGSIHIQDAQPRQVTSCKAPGSYCRVPLIMHPEVNVTFTNGRCNAHCRCEPSKGQDGGDDDDDTAPNIRHFVGSLIASRHHHLRRSQFRLHSGPNRFGVIRLAIPALNERNETACEDYESNYRSHGHTPPELKCKEVCSLNGHIGSLQFDGPLRTLHKNKADGSFCELSLNGADRLELSGVRQIVTGRCVKGVCRPVHWKEPEHVTPTLKFPTVLNIAQRKPQKSWKVHPNSEIESIEDNRIDSGDLSSSSSSDEFI